MKWDLMDNTGGGRANETQGIPNRDHQLAHPQRVRIARYGRGQARCFHLQNCQVAPPVSIHDLARQASSIPKLHFHCTRISGASHNMRVGDDASIARPDYAGPATIRMRLHLDSGMPQILNYFFKCIGHFPYLLRLGLSPIRTPKSCTAPARRTLNFTICPAGVRSRRSARASGCASELSSAATRTSPKINPAMAAGPSGSIPTNM